MAGLTRLASNYFKRPTADSAVLFICDVQEVFRPVIHNMPAVIHNTEYVNNVCNLLHIPTIITEHYAKAFGKTVNEITLHPTTKIIQKTQFSMLVPDLRPELPSTRKQVILCGIETHVCVQQTTLDLLREEYDVFVICDAVSSQRPYDRTVALNRLSAAGAILTTAESLIFDLMKDAKHPNFKQISGLIKKQKDIPDANLFDHQTIV